MIAESDGPGRPEGKGTRMGGGVRYVWRGGEPPEGLVVTQVWGWLFDWCGRVLLLRDEDGSIHLPGGTVEERDADWVATLRREAAEEAQATVAGPLYLGHQVVHEPGAAPYAQVRMAGWLSSLGPGGPDPATGREYRRFFVPPHEANTWLGWGREGEAQAAAAVAALNLSWQGRRVTVGSR